MLKQGMPPVHPGEIMKEMYLEPLEVNIRKAIVVDFFHVMAKGKGSPDF